MVDSTGSLAPKAILFTHGYVSRMKNVLYDVVKGRIPSFPNMVYSVVGWRETFQVSVGALSHTVCTRSGRVRPPVFCIITSCLNPEEQPDFRVLLGPIRQ